MTPSAGATDGQTLECPPAALMISRNSSSRPAEVGQEQTFEPKVMR